MAAHVECQCCFCGEKIKNIQPDPCALNLIANWLLTEDQQVNQCFYCHIKCLEARLHSSVPFYVKDMLEDD
jgi:hypothetical protein